jgi:hypothetical protein
MNKYLSSPSPYQQNSTSLSKNAPESLQKSLKVAQQDSHRRE